MDEKWIMDLPSCVLTIWLYLKDEAGESVVETVFTSLLAPLFLRFLQKGTEAQQTKIILRWFFINW